VQSWMLAHLAQRTRPHHLAADRDRLAVMENATPERYRAFLAQIYCFEAPVEAASLATSGFHASIVAKHSRRALLARDLAALGLQVGEASHTSFATTFEGASEALGWMYAIERNALVHGLVARYLATQLPDTMRVASSYLTAFDGRAGEKLRELAMVLEHVAQRSTITERIVAAATEAFHCQHHWYTCDLMPRRPRRTSRPPRVPSRAA
jgi:heme oxygenase